MKPFAESPRLGPILFRGLVIIIFLTVCLLSAGKDLNAATSCPSPSFGVQSMFPAGTNPGSLAVGDFNGDGKMDLVAGNSNSNDASILLGNGDGTFQAATNIALGGSQTFVAAGDFNGDGKLDLVVARYNTVSILLGNGNGTFAAPVNYAVGSWAYSIAIGDFNSDGNPDVAVANYLSGDASVLLGNGNGTFQPAVSYSVGTYPVSIAVGDFNGDGKPDVAVANYLSGDASVLLGIGDGTFQTAVSFAAGAYPESMAVGDFNADGKLDLAVANYSDSDVSILLGNGNGTFQTAVSYGLGSGALSVAVGDFNGDGKPDLAVVVHSYNDVLIFQGNGNGTFQTALRYGVGLGVEYVEVGDFNNDGKPDLVTANFSSNNVSLLLNACGSSCSAILVSPASIPTGFVGSAYNQTLTATGGTSPYNFTVGSGAIPPGLSLSSSGTISGAPTTPGDAYWFTAVATDLSVCGGSRTYAMTVGALPTAITGTATNVTSNSATLNGMVNPNWLDTTVSFQWGTTTGYGSATPPQSIGYWGSPLSIPASLGSLVPNTDYHYRVVATNSAGTSYGADVAFTTSAGGCNTPTFLLMQSISVGTSTYISVGDLNADGRADLAITGTQAVAIALGNGNGTFGSLVNYTAGGVPQSSVLGDFNGDGRLDLAVENWYSNNVSILRGNGNGTFQAAVNYSVGTSPVSIALGDFNADGKLDLVVANVSSNNVSILLGNGDGTFQAAVNFIAGSSPQSVVIGDFNEDGRPDLAVANSGVNTISILLGNGNGAFQPPVSFIAGTSPYSVAIGDFNGDGKLDLAVANRVSNNVSILLGNGNGTFQAAVNYAVGSFPYFIVASDLTKDGRVDLAVANLTSSNISLLVGNGDGTFQAALDVGVGSGPFAIGVGDFNGDLNPDLAVVNYYSHNVSILANARSASCPTIVLSPDTLPGGVAGTAYNQVLTASGGTSSYSYAVSGGTMPPGLDLSSTGTLSGTLTGTGKFAFTVTATDADGYTGSQTYRMTVTTVFNDVPTTHPFYSFINRLYASGITAGCGGGNYCPDSQVTREQMAIFIERGLGVNTPPIPTQQTFEDVPTSWFSYPFIEDFATRGITAGCSITPRLYCPASTVTREQMAIFIEHALGVMTPPAPTQQTFEDVPTSWFSYPFIEDFATRGITAGCSVTPKLYCPASPVTRGQMAVFLVHAFGL
ncbi:MAG: FG-GAP-like repeat-containing protein [Acidobacteriia bacterium]|nr:FG-GAP-like repeat-containing protein [Terriglobia bacterium]